MSRRPPLAEQGFGSDAFLDVVANVVGVLIILMVLAGLRAAKAPVDLSSDNNVASAVSTKPPATPSQPASSEPAEPEPSDALLNVQAEAMFLESELNELRAAADRLQTALADARTKLSDQQTELASLAELRTEAASRPSDLRDLEDTARQVRVKLKQREAELAAAENAPRKVVRLEHRISPLSRVVTEGEVELHFRCLANRVAYVPVTELVERMRAQVTRQRDVVIRTKRFTGSVGPVRGFSLEYLTQNEEMSVLGGTIQRTRLVGFQLVTEPDLQSESLSDALRPESAFRNELRRIEQGATVTFWVYPDSFTMFRQLQSLAHRAGYQVAARPLPEGIPIMGSPHGSRSSAQ